MAETYKLLNGWGQLGMLLLTAGGMLVGGVLWIESSIRTASEANIIAIASQAATAASLQSANEKRITTLEVQMIAREHVVDELLAQTNKLRDVETDLYTAIQVLTRQQPTGRQR